MTFETLLAPEFQIRGGQSVRALLTTAITDYMCIPQFTLKQRWWLTSIIPAVCKWRQENCESEVSQSYKIKLISKRVSCVLI